MNRIIAIAPPFYKEQQRYENWLKKRKFIYRILSEDDELKSDNLLMLCGGADIGRRPERDKLENEWIEQAINLNIPILGICRGMQMINVYLGGSLIIDINSKIKHCKGQYHLVADLNGERIRVNSYHHQAIKVLGNGIIPTAFADDGIIEAAKVNGLDILLVQWHPEQKNVYGTYCEQVVSNWVCKYLTL